MDIELKLFYYIIGSTNKGEYMYLDTDFLRKNIK